ncbi:FixH family protein [Pedobacter sp. B4-66]|uniref:FixH family protein n=1 Tax=Pedobacter sp. B4-66 TaxID=2817280 RepID=UPI001BDB6B9E|nr:FixH family protein [Pedobacter sp. B4-66]
MNWGTKLIIGMLSFMTFIVVLAVLMIRSETDALVDQDYYEKGLNYDHEFTLKEQVIKDNALPVIRLSDESLIITFKTEATGTLKIMRTAKKSMDRMMNFKSDSNKNVILSSKDLAKGNWKFIMQWKANNGIAYLNEQEVSIP